MAISWQVGAVPTSALAAMHHQGLKPHEARRWRTQQKLQNAAASLTMT